MEGREEKRRASVGQFHFVDTFVVVFVCCSPKKPKKPPLKCLAARNEFVMNLCSVLYRLGAWQANESNKFHVAASFI